MKKRKLPRRNAENCIDRAHESACKEWRELEGKKHMEIYAAEAYGKAVGLEAAAFFLDRKLGRPAIFEQSKALQQAATAAADILAADIQADGGLGYAPVAGAPEREEEGR